MADSFGGVSGRASQPGWGRRRCSTLLWRQRQRQRQLEEVRWVRCRGRERDKEEILRGKILDGEAVGAPVKLD